MALEAEVHRVGLGVRMPGDLIDPVVTPPGRRVRFLVLHGPILTAPGEPPRNESRPRFLAMSGNAASFRKCLAVREEADPRQVGHPAAHLAAVEVVAGDPEPGARHELVIGAEPAVAAVVARGAG